MTDKKKSVTMLVLSIALLLLPLPLCAIMTLFEPEVNEAIVGGVLIGWGIGGLISAAILPLNFKKKNSLAVAANLLSIIGLVVLIFSFLISVLAD